MKNTALVWETFILAKSSRISPSELIGLNRKEEPWAAYCIDRAVTTFGLSLESELGSVEGKNSNEIQVAKERILARWIPNTGGPKFADPAKRR